MKLYYFKDPHGNFGDDLNPWLWDKLMPGVLDDDDRQLFVGIGTLINHRIPAEPVKHVFGSGVGYGDKPRAPDSFRYHALRGYESAKALGVSSDKVITDAAILIRATEYPRTPLQDKAFGFVPHCYSSQCYDWTTVCDALDMHHIDVRWEVERCLVEMSRCKVLVCEAMHGAIVADALRIPWIPVSCYEFISEFKWRDWLSSLNLPYHPAQVTSLYDFERNLDLINRLKNSLKRSLRFSGVWSTSWTPPPPSRTGVRDYEQALVDLRAALTREPILSTDTIIESHTSRYLELIEQFKKQHKPA